MSTKSEQFSAKIRSLHDYQNRLIHNINPVPTGFDIANTLKYFTNTLRGILKGAPEPTEAEINSKRRINVRLSHFPNLDYFGLYGALVNLIDIMPSVQYGQSALGEAILQTFACIIAFLEPDILETLPYTVATTLAIFPASVNKETVELLCKTFLPMTLSFYSFSDDTDRNEPSYVTLSTSAITMLVLQQTTNKACHAQLVESMMTYAGNVCKDLLCVIAYGPQNARKPAVHLLFHYWPSLIPPLTEVRDYKYVAWKPISCQRSDCSNPSNKPAVKICMDPSVSAQYSETPPPLYVCTECSDLIARETNKILKNVLLPQEHVSKVCENKNCTSLDKLAVVTCYDSECTRYHGNKAVRYCQNCHQHQHGVESSHILQGLPPDPWNCPLEEQSYMVEAIVSLLKEAQPLDEKRVFEMGVSSSHHYSAGHHSNLRDHIDNEEWESQDGSGDGQRILSRYGVWMLVEKCTPGDNTPVEVFGRMLSMLFQWFVSTACQVGDDAGVALEQLKPEYLANWLIGLSHSHFDVLVSCLLPHPPEYAKVGGHWETLSSTLCQLEEGINRILALTPYNIVSFEVWDYIMPHWVEAIYNDVSEDDLMKLQDPLQKLLAIDLCPLPFSTEKMFSFVSRKFENSPSEEQEHGLTWLQILSQLEIVIPLQLVLSMFNKGVTGLIPSDQAVSENEPAATTTPDVNKKKHVEIKKLTGNELRVTCFVMMLDLVLKQAELQDLPFHQGLEDSLSKDMVSLITQMLSVGWNENHKCSEDEHLECTLCELTALWFQLALDLITYIAPRDPIKISELMEITDKKLEQTINEALHIHESKSQASHESSDAEPSKEKVSTPSVDDLLNMGNNIDTEFVAPNFVSANGFSATRVTSTMATSNGVSFSPTFTVPSTGVSRQVYPLLSETDTLSSLSAEALCTAVAENGTSLYSASSAHTKMLLTAQHASMPPHPSILKESTPQLTIANTTIPAVITTNAATNGTTTKTTIADANKHHKKGQSVEINIPVIDPSEKSKTPNGSESSSSEDKWPTSHGVFTFRISEFPKSLQLLYAFLKELPRHDDPDILLHLVSCIKVLCLNAECLNNAAKDHIGFLIWLQENLLLPSFWKFLHADLSHVVQILVLLILHCMALPGSMDVFWELVDTEFNSDDWQVRFNAVECITVMCRFIEKKMISNNAAIMSSLAHSFCYLISCVDDICPSVSAKAVLMIESIKRRSLKVLVSCLEFQWDSVIDDRRMILRHISILHHYLPDINALSWEFFMNRLDTISLEAQVDLEQNKEFPFPVDMTRSNAGLMDRSEAFMRKLNRARFARSRSESVRSLSLNITARYLRPTKHGDYRRTVSMPVNVPVNKMRVRHRSGEKSTYSRQISEPILPHSCLGDNLFSDGHLKNGEDDWFEIPPEIDLSSLDKETIHNLIFLMMKFMTTTDIENNQDERFAGKAMNTVLRHTMVLLGYNQYEKAFSLSPHQLRQSAVYYALLTGLPKVLDKNVKLGTQLMLLTVDLLKYCPSPQKSPHDFQPVDYTLWYLEPHCRHSWLMTLLVILYKYRLDMSTMSKQIHDLIRIAMNTIDAQVHFCKPKKPEPPQAEDIWGATSPALPAQKAGVIEEEDDSSIETESSAPHSPSSPLLEAESQPPLPTNANVNVTIPQENTAANKREENASIFAKIFSKSKDESKGKMLSTSWSVGDFRKSGSGKIAKSISYSALSKESRVTGVDHNGRQPTSIDAKQHLHGLPESPVIKEEEDEEEDGENDYDDEEEEEESAKPEQPLLKSDEDSTPLVTIDDLLRSSTPQFTLGGDGDSSASDPTTPPNGQNVNAQQQQQEGTPIPSDSMDEKRTPESARTSESESDIPKFIRSSEPRNIVSGLSSVVAQKLALGGEREYTKAQTLKKASKGAQKEIDKAKREDRKSRRQRVKSKRRSSKGKTKHSSVFSAVRRYHDDKNIIVANKCSECGVALEEYDEDTISLAIVTLSTYVHRDPSQSAPLLMEMLQVVGRIAGSTLYPWQPESLVNTPASSITVARQFLRCTLHQMAPMGIFPQLFQTRMEDPYFMKTLAASLTDFNELNPIAPISYLLEGLNFKKTLPGQHTLIVLYNLADYLECLPTESAAVWSPVLPLFETFFRKLLGFLPDHCDMTSTFRIMIALLKTPISKNLQALLDPFSKVISYALQKCRCKLQNLLDICMACHRTFIKERDKIYLTRATVLELSTALKFKSALPDANILLILQLVLLDSGGRLSESNILEEEIGVYDIKSLGPTGAADCMKQSLSDALEFIGDLHTLTKVKNNMKGGSQNLNEDTLGSHLKAGIAQFIAVEFTYANQRDSRGINRYLPWLCHPPSTMQQGPREFIDCIAHIRMLSWLLLGSLMHSAMFDNAIDNNGVTCQPIPLEAGIHIADHVLVILTGFSELSKTSVLHMSSLFHAFILCQLWTMYCEQSASSSSANSELHSVASLTIMDFWGRVTPGILQLLSHSKVLAEMVNLHFLGLMEALQECNSSVLSKLFPLWTPILYSYHAQLPGSMHVRLQTVENYQPADPTKMEVLSYRSQMLLKWLKRLQFKMGQIEIQSSAATQFYTV
ncbi:LOW QUALITY PROTEIN: protein unc-79 homolog [Saccoglossus kowalevskii]